LWLLISCGGWAAETNDRQGFQSIPGASISGEPYLVPITTNDIHIDGVLDAAEWRNALVLNLAYETDPGENGPAPVQTEVLLASDQSNLYAAFRCYDPDPAAIRAHLCDRESFWSDDAVSLHIDTFNDHRRNFTFGVNPFGVQMDGVATVGRGTDYSWDAIWDSAGQIHHWGYAVEMAVPFNQLRFPREEGGQVWGFNAERTYPRNVNCCVALVPHDRDDSCRQCQFAEISGFAGAKPGHGLEFNPTLTTVRTDARDEMPDGDFQQEHEDTEMGVSLQWGLTSNLTLNGTFHPDFSQVEADAVQLDINQPFALWYPERRPFFTEGAHFFDTLKNVVYTRTLRDPIWGGKLTGKEGHHSVGVYWVRDEITNLLFPGSQGSNATSLDQESTAHILRYKRDVGSRSTLGVMYTGREGTSYHNRLIGLDGDLRLSPRDQIQLQLLTSRTAYPDETAADYDQPRGEFGGEFLAFEYDHDARSAYWWLDLEEVDRGFRGDLGFLPQVGYRNVEGGANYTWFGSEGSWWTRFIAGWNFRFYEEQNGSLLSKGTSLWTYYRGAMQSWLNASADFSRQLYSGREFELLAGYLSVGFEPSGSVETWISVAYGDRIDYANTRPGERIRFDPGLELQLGQHVRLNAGHTFERLNAGRGRLYTANISRLTAIYQINVRAFFRAILQYAHYDRNAENYDFEVDPEQKSLLSQLLFSYTLNPRTVLYLGYSDGYRGSQDYDLTQESRTFFAKMGYAWGL
jgi:hypothetical protein